MLRRLIFFLGLLVFSLATAALVLFGAFLAWRIPREKAEARVFQAEVRLDDGPHVTWLPDNRVRVSEIRFERTRDEFQVLDRVLSCAEAQVAAASIDPNARFDCVPKPASVCSVALAPLVAAVSDVHGHYRHLATLLRQAGVVDQRLDWAFGAGHLVVNGDVLDKGPEVTRCLWLIKKLEQQAGEAGGQLHFLLGNHDHLALTGRSRINDQKYIKLADATGIAYASLFSPATELGRWIRRHGVAVRVNDSLFVHGGISPALLDAGATLDELNGIARSNLSEEGVRSWSSQERLISSLIWGQEGLVWYRGYFDRSFPLGFWRTFRGDLRENQAAEAAISRVCSQYGCRRIVVGHTDGREIRSLFGGRLVAISQRLGMFDVLDDGARGEVLLIDGRALTRVTITGQRLPL
ncbi:MAG TPA: metallophosphoesterase [Vicinamibacterales bacterium]|nr:metallophosphoesterase [Vicinamibacterales bacterium]